MSVFAHIGSKFNNVDINQKTYMSPTQIYNNLCEYLVYCMFIYDSGVSGPAGSAPTRVSTGANSNILEFSPQVKSINNVELEDKLFVLTIKAMSAKIFTVLGLQDVMRRPLESMKFSPMRVMLGGADEMPKVEDGALELYLRLPLLAYFYRDLFRFYNDDGTDGSRMNLPTYRDIGNLARKPDLNPIKITMIPDMEGTFSGLIELIFNKARNTSYNNLSDSDMSDLIREVNGIYEKMHAKHHENVVMETIYEFVNEINRRIGIYLKSDVDKMINERAPRYDYSYDDSKDADDENVELLPGEGEIQVERPTPSSAYTVGPNMPPGSNRGLLSPYNLNAEHQRLIYLFRCKLDKVMEHMGESGLYIPSYFGFDEEQT